MARKPPFIGISGDAIRAQELRKPEFRRHYEERRIVHEIAIEVRSMREAAGLTQAQLANMIGSSQPAIARIERGVDQRVPRWDTLRRIAVAVGKQLKLVFGPPSEHPKLVEVAKSPRRRGRVSDEKRASR